MSDKSAIEWTDATWNPVRGCSRVSPGCGGPNHEGGCYAEKIAARFSDPGQPFHGFAERTPHGGRWTGKLALIEDQLTLPLHWKRPRKIFVNSMSDLFHEALADEAIDKVFAIMALAPQHQFQVLTKRAERMREYVNAPKGWPVLGIGCEWPLRNVWLGVSAEDQERADERIPLLLDTPAAVRFVSCEPLLGAIDLRPWLSDESGCSECDDGIMSGVNRCNRDDIPRDEQCPDKFAVFNETEHGPFDAEGAPDAITVNRVTLDWVIVGGESGPKARPMHPAWARSLRDQCQAAGVPFFYKQWGEWLPWLQFNDAVAVSDPEPDSRFPSCIWLPDKSQWDFDYDQDFHGPGASGPEEMDEIMGRVGKKAAGRLLDGVEHNAFPLTATPSSLRSPA